MEYCRRDAEDGVPFSDEDDRRFLQIEQQCVRLCFEAADLMLRTSGTSAASKTAPLGRYFRNLAVIRTHVTMQGDHTAANCRAAALRSAAAQPTLGPRSPNALSASFRSQASCKIVGHSSEAE